MFKLKLMNNRWRFQCRVADNKVDRGMQSFYVDLDCMFKSKTKTLTDYQPLFNRP